MNLIFGSHKVGVAVWGPTASVEVKVPALGGLVDNSWILTGVSVGAKEIVDVRQCFNDVSYIYALGNNQSQCSMVLTFAVLIGSKECKGKGENLSAISGGLKAYMSNRISKHPDPHTVTIGGFSKKGWLVDISVGNTDASRGICQGVLNFIMQLKDEKESKRAG